MRSGRTGRWPASGHGAPDASDREMEALGALCCAPDAEVWCIQCDTVLRPVILLTVGVRSDHWRFAAELNARGHVDGDGALDAGCLRLVVHTSASSGVEFGLVKGQRLV
jgi:hypothetical protein